MSTSTRPGVKLNSKSTFLEKESDVVMGQFIFEYQIEIINSNNFDLTFENLQLFIFDSLEKPQEVRKLKLNDSTRIIGQNQQAITTEYIRIRSGIGSIKGFISFTKKTKNESILIEIPKTILEYCGKKN